MSYELRRDESLGENLRRICRKQIELAIQVCNGDLEVRDTPVHETRRHLKKARAVLRLLRDGIGATEFDDQESCLRKVARSISQIRDAEVRLQTVRELQGIKQRKSASYNGLEAMLTLELENFIAAFTEWQLEAIPLLEQARAPIDDWPIDNLTFRDLCSPVQKSYKRARKALSRAKASAIPENFHTLRSKAKVLDYQLRILCPADPVVLANVIDELDSLGKLLGRAHDLHFLCERLRVERGKAPWQRQGHKLLSVIETSQSELEQGAAELGERFFAERPRDFGARVGAWISDWSHARAPSIAKALVS
jgi:CHAD domain-containing protein